MKQRIFNLLIALDQFVFCLITLGHSRPDETISAWAWRSKCAGKLRGRVACGLIDWVFWFDPEHCKRSFESELQRRQLPGEYT